MRFEFRACSPHTTSVESAIRIDLTLRMNKHEALLHLDGLLLAEDGKLLTTLTPFRETTRLTPREVAARGSSQDNMLGQMNEESVSVVGFLSEKVIDYVHALRDKNLKRDVRFTVKLKPVVLQPRAYVAHFHSDLGIQGREVVTWKYDPNYSSSVNNRWVISGDGSPVFLQVVEQQEEVPIIIKSSDWVQEFAPHLGIGNFVVAELPVPEIERTNQHPPKLTKAVEALSEIKAKIQAGEWREACEKARPVIELLNEPDMIRSILNANGHPPEATSALVDALQKLHTYTSKFIHKVGQDRKTLLPDIVPEKEDAYFVQSLAVSLVNMLTQKARRAAV